MNIDKFREQILLTNANLIEQGKELIKNCWQDRHGMQRVNIEPLYLWLGNISSFKYQLGNSGKPWLEVLNSTDQYDNSAIHVKKLLDTLSSIKSEIENNHLASFNQIVQSETLIDLLEQAEHLLSKNYFLAAGVIGRAILEQSLRDSCKANNINIEKDKPTLNDFNIGLYKSEVYNKSKMKLIDSLISIGNDAAHNIEGLTKRDVKRLILELPSIIDTVN